MGGMDSEMAPMGRQVSRRRSSAWRVALTGCAAGLAIGVVLFPLDGPIESLARGIRGAMGGDVVRELEALQQFGQGAFIVLIAWAIWLLDPPRRRRLLDWGLGIAILNAMVLPMKMLVGRPRPAVGEPGYFLGPFGAHPFPDADPPGVYYAWDLAAQISSELWSMPSSHTAHAVLAAVFLGLLYPRLRPLLIAMACLVGVARMLFGAHYASDVAVGAGLGWAVGMVSTRRFLGVRALDAVWRACVDRRAAPAFPAALRLERDRDDGAATA